MSSDILKAGKVIALYRLTTSAQKKTESIRFPETPVPAHETTLVSVCSGYEYEQKVAVTSSRGSIL
jgi:hypothetical protein